MNVEHVLSTTREEFRFFYPPDMPPDRSGPNYKKLRVDRIGLRIWDGFEEDPAYLQEFMKRSTGYPAGWKPAVFEWTRYASSETTVVDLLKSTLMLRVNIALDIISPGVTIIGTPKYFQSYGTDDNRLEGAPEVRIGPDLVTLDKFDKIIPVGILQHKILAFGEVKVRNTKQTKNSEMLLPGTQGCYESWLAQAVQICIDQDLPLGWLQTNHEIVLFHLSRFDGNPTQGTTATPSSESSSSPLQSLPSDGPPEPDYSSPVIRLTHHWKMFYEGDGEVPLVNGDMVKAQLYTTPMHDSHPVFDSPKTVLPSIALRSSPSQRKRPREDTPEALPSSQQSASTPYTPCPNPRVTSKSLEQESYPPSSSQADKVPSSEFKEDIRAHDVSHVFIKTYPLSDGRVAKRLLELIMLAKRAKDLDCLKIGPWKLSHSALSALEEARRS